MEFQSLEDIFHIFPSKLSEMTNCFYTNCAMLFKNHRLIVISTSHLTNIHAQVFHLEISQMKRGVLKSVSPYLRNITKGKETRWVGVMGNLWINEGPRPEIISNIPA